MSIFKRFHKPKLKESVEEVFDSFAPSDAEESKDSQINMLATINVMINNCIVLARLISQENKLEASLKSLESDIQKLIVSERKSIHINNIKSKMAKIE